MPELELVSGNSYYWTGRLSIGVYLDEASKSAVLIDTGIDDDTIKKVDKAIAERGYTVGAVINTHSHADHCGGNAWLQQKYPGMRVYATRWEGKFIEDPLLEPLCFCQSALPLKELRVKFLEARPSRVTDLLAGDVTINGKTFGIVALPGHTPGMVAVQSPDNVLYLGDALFGEETYAKHGMLFYTDIGETLKSFDKALQVKAQGYVLYHGGKVGTITDLVEKHRKKVIATSHDLLGYVRAASPSLDQLLQHAMETYEIPQDVVQHTLTSACVRAFVAYLQQQGQVTVGIENGLLRVKPA